MNGDRLLMVKAMDILKEFRKKVGHLVEGDVLEKEYGKIIIDEEVRETTKKFGFRLRGGVRITHGLFYTDEEKEKEKKELLKVKLP